MMATYTIELRKVCEIYGRDEVEKWFSSYNYEDFLTKEQIKVLTFENIWNKEKLAKKIVDHYFMREIGFETPALFRHYAKVRMNEIMEGYLLKIYTKFLEYDPLSSVDYVETYTREITGTSESEGSSNSNSSSNGSSLAINSNTPQGQISKDEILKGTYASSTSAGENETNINDETNTNQKGTSNTLETYTHQMKGDNGVIVTNQYLIREFRELAVNLDEEIILDLNDLFIGLF